MKKILAINLLVLLLGLALVEAIFGDWIFSDPLGQLNILKNVDLQFDATPLYGEAGRSVRYTRDSYGFRGLKSDASTIDLLTIGGSSTDQRYLSDGKTWQDILEADLLEGGQSMEVVNAGLDGQSSYGEIKDFEIWFPQIPGLKPRYVLLYNGINDLFSDLTVRYDDLAGNETLKGIIRSKSALFNLYQKIRGAFSAYYRYPVSHRVVDFSSLQWTDSPLQRDHSMLLREKLEKYEGNLVRLNEEIRKAGAIPIFATQTSAMFRRQEGKILGISDEIQFQGKSINGVDFFYLLSLINERTLAFCRRSESICIDLEGELPFEDGDFYDYFHNTPQGAMKVGHYLFRKLKDVL